MIKRIIFLVMALCLLRAQCFALVTGFFTGSTSISGYTDSFTRSDENPIASPWILPSFASHPLQIVSGKVAATSNLNENIAYYNGTFSDNQYSQIYVSESEGDSSSYPIGVVVRCQTGSTKSYYVLVRDGSSQIELWKLFNGAWSSLSTQSASFTGGKTMRLEVSGSSTITLVMKVGGATIASVEDSTNPITTGYPGMYSSGVNEYIDDWEGGDL